MHRTTAMRSVPWIAPVVTCDTCGAPAVVVAPGEAEIREVFLLRREVPQRCWCLTCWRRVFGAVEATA